LFVCVRALAQVEEPALALLLHALQTKKQLDLTRAIDAAEAADAAFAANAEEVAAWAGRETLNLVLPQRVCARVCVFF
jgi:hypothetical protein